MTSIGNVRIVSDYDSSGKGHRRWNAGKAGTTTGKLARRHCSSRTQGMWLVRATTIWWYRSYSSRGKSREFILAQKSKRWGMKSFYWRNESKTLFLIHMANFR